MKDKKPYVPDIKALKQQIKRPSHAVVTAGMPYANGPLHIGHLAGAHIPADIYARWLGLLVGREQVLFVCGTDDHGSTSELAALKAGKPIQEFLGEIHAKQSETLKSYNVGLDIYSGTSRPECYPIHVEVAQDFIRRMHANGMLEKKTSKQWYDPALRRFLQDRFVRGTCPNPKCENREAYSDECDRCGQHHLPSELIDPRSELSDSAPELKDTAHLYLNMWKVADSLQEWIGTKKKTWRQAVFNEVANTVVAAFAFPNTHEELFKSLKEQLPPHKSKYAPGKKIQVQFANQADMNTAKTLLESENIPCTLVDGWAHRAITRDVSWGIPVPTDVDPDLKDKTLYVWPDSLIAPISFTKVALKSKNQPTTDSDHYWRNQESQIFQFLGQDNVFFYVIMQGAMWLGTQDNPNRQPSHGDYQLTDVFGCHHLMVGGEKMSKSRGNFYTGDQLIHDKGYSADQIRYFLALLSLPEKASNFDFDTLNERNRFLAGPMNAAFEKPISACHSKFAGTVPEGSLMEKVSIESARMIQRYLNMMPKAEYSKLLFAIENYARQINSLFTQYKPHDDRVDEQGRKDALYSCFYVLKNIMIMLYPFVPETMDRLRQSLNLDPSVLSVDELGIPIPAGHPIGQQCEYFPAVNED